LALLSPDNLTEQRMLTQDFMARALCTKMTAEYGDGIDMEAGVQQSRRERESRERNRRRAGPEPTHREMRLEGAALRGKPRLLDALLDPVGQSHQR